EVDDDGVARRGVDGRGRSDGGARNAQPCRGAEACCDRSKNGAHDCTLNSTMEKDRRSIQGKAAKKYCRACDSPGANSIDDDARLGQTAVDDPVQKPV